MPAEAGEGVEESAEIGGGGLDGVEEGLGFVDFGYVGVGEFLDLAHALGGVLDALDGALHEHGDLQPPQVRRGVGDAEAEEGVAAAEVVVEEGERGADGEAVEPEGDLGEFHGQGILVDAVDTALEDEAADDGLVGQLGLVDLPVGLAGAVQDVGADGGDAVQEGRLVGVVLGQPVGEGGSDFDQVGDVVGQEVNRSDEEVAAAHGWIEHLEVKDGLGGVQSGQLGAAFGPWAAVTSKVVGSCLEGVQTFLDQRLEGLVDDEVHEVLRGVEAAAVLASVGVGADSDFAVWL